MTQSGKTLEQLLEDALRRMVNANAGLSKIKNKITLYETSPSKDQDAFEAWSELDTAIKEAKYALLAAQISREPDDEQTAGRELL